MINSIIGAISISLNAEFTEKEYEVHMEEIRQDLKEPCFFISCVNPTSNLFLWKRYFRENKFVIQYFPESTNDSQRECNEVAERMILCLEYITVFGEEKPIRGIKMKYEVVDGVLNFFVNYDCFVRRIEADGTQETLETLKTSTTVKEGD